MSNSQKSDQENPIEEKEKSPKKPTETKEEKKIIHIKKENIEEDIQSQTNGFIHTNGNLSVEKININTEKEEEIDTTNYSTISTTSRYMKRKELMSEDQKQWLKEYSREQKHSQRNSLILRQYAMMRLLVVNYNYTFLIQRFHRTATQALNYCPIEKIYNEKEVCIYDSSRNNTIKNRQDRLHYSQKEALQIMTMELEEKGYVFDKRQTKKATITHNGNDPLTSTKIYSMITPKEHEFEMRRIENTIGMDGYNVFTELVIGNREAEKFMYSQRNEIERKFIQMIERGEIENEKGIFIGEGYEVPLEEIYLRKWTEESSIQENNDGREMIREDESFSMNIDRSD